MPPASMVQRFCIMLHAILSSQVQVIFMPPVHFSIFMVQRGTIRKLAGTDEGDIMPGIPMPGVPTTGMPILDRSIIMLTIGLKLLFAKLKIKARRGGHVNQSAYLPQVSFSQ